MNYSVLRNDESGKYKYIHSITDRVLLNAITLLYKSSLQNDSALFVPLIVLRSKLIHPSKFGITVFAIHIPDHMPAGQHHPVLHLAELEVDHLVEEECSPCSSSEPGGNKLIPVGEDGLTGGTGEEASSSHMLDENPTHFLFLQIWSQFPWHWRQTFQ